MTLLHDDDGLLQLTVSMDGPRTVVIAVAGELDSGTCALLEGVLDAQPCNARIVLDLAEVTFIGSAGVSVLLRAEARGQRFALRHLSAPAMRTLQLLGMTSHFDVTDPPSEVRGRAAPAGEARPA